MYRRAASRQGRGSCHPPEFPHHARPGRLGQPPLRRRVRQRSEGGRQPGYKPVEAFRPPMAAGPSATRPRVSVLLGRPYGGDGRSRPTPPVATRPAPWRRCSPVCTAPMPGTGRSRTVSRRAVAASRGSEGAERLRPLRWGDVALLFRATTGLETYEQALREAGVPYRVEAAKPISGAAR